MQAYFRCLRPLRRLRSIIGLVLRVSQVRRDGDVSCVHGLGTVPPLTCFVFECPLMFPSLNYWSGAGEMNAVEIQQLVKRKRFLSVKEGAEIHGVKPRFLYKRFGSEGGPPYKRRGRMFKLPTYDFIMWSEQAETP